MKDCTVTLQFSSSSNDWAIDIGRWLSCYIVFATPHGVKAYGHPLPDEDSQTSHECYEAIRELPMLTASIWRRRSSRVWELREQVNLSKMRDFSLVGSSLHFQCDAEEIASACLVSRVPASVPVSAESIRAYANVEQDRIDV